jgi:CHAT domain-containing protein/Tfp pilus assembly protein PilF
VWGVGRLELVRAVWHPESSGEAADFAAGTFQERNMSGRPRSSTKVGRVRIAFGSLVLIGVLSWAALALVAAVEEQPAPVAAPHAEREYTPEEQVQLADADAKHNQVVDLYGEGRYVEAISVAQEVVAIRKRILGERHLEYATGLGNLALMYRSVGDYERAEVLFQQALEIDRVALGDVAHPDYAIDLNNLASLYLVTGKYAQAEPLYREALDIRKQLFGEQHPAFAQSLNNLGGLYFEMGDYARAEPAFRQVLEIDKKIYGEQSAEYAAGLNNLGLLYEVTGDIARAEPMLREVVELRREILGEDHPLYARSLGNLATLYQSLGDYSQAKDLYQQALGLFEQSLGVQHPEYAMVLTNLAGLYGAMGDAGQAEPLYRQSLEILKLVGGEWHPDYAASLSGLAELYSARGEFARADPLHRQALDISTELVDAGAIVQSESGQLSMSRKVRSYLDDYVCCRMLMGDDDAAGCEAVLNWKGATLVRQRAARSAADNAELAPLLVEVQSVVRQWSALATSTPPADPLWRQRLAELTDRKEQLESELSRRSAAFRQAINKEPLADLKSALPENVALVNYFEFSFSQPSRDKLGTLASRRSLAAFVFRPNRAVAMFDLGEVASIHTAIDQWRASFGASDEAQAAGALLRERLWAPLEEAIGDSTLVLVSPDGALGKLPFAALPGSEPGTYLIEDLAIALVPVPRLIPELLRSERSAEEMDRELLLVGGLDYDRREDGGAGPSLEDEELYAVARSRGTARETADGLSWGALPGSSAEAAAIGELFQKLKGADEGAVAVLTGAAATEEQFRALAPTSRILHMATHGFFAPEGRRSALEVEEAEDDSPLGGGFQVSATADLESEKPGYVGFPTGLLSGLVLAGANDPPELPEDPAAFADLPEDGILTAEELAFLRLEGVELAVLSACETGLGEVAGGEGLLGIQRAFQISGVRTTVATLWKVDDAMTQRLMTAFYRNVLQGKQSYLEALRNAQLEMLRELRDRPDEFLAELRGAGVEGERAAALLDDDAALERGAPYFWAAFTLSGDWR